MVNLSDLTPEQRMALAQEALDVEQGKQKQRKHLEAQYKELVDDAITESFKRLETVSKDLSKEKKMVYGVFNTVLEMKQEIFPKKEHNHTHTFTSADGQYRIKLGYNLLDSYTDTAEDGIQMVKDYLESLVDGKNSQQLIAAVLKLLARDLAGHLKASRVLQLQKIAEESGNHFFLEGVRLIRQAYSPIRTKQFIRAWRRGEYGEWEALPLGMTEA